MLELPRPGNSVDRWKRTDLVAGGIALALIGGWLWYRTSNNHRFDRSTTSDTRHAAGAPADAMEIERSITIGESPDELYRFCRDPQRLSHIVGHVAEVTAVDENRQHWDVPLPLGRLGWDAQIVEERPEVLRWESLAGAEVPNEGSVHFRPAPGNRGTEVTLRFRCDPPGGLLGDTAMKLLNIGPGLAGTALRRFKSLVETDEIPTLERNPSARGSGDTI